MYKFLSSILVFFCLVVVAESQLSVTIQNVPPQNNVNTEEFPLLKINVRVSDGGNQVAISKNDFYILEGATVCEPTEVSGITNGWQTIKWYTKINDYTSLGEYQGQLLTIYNNTPDRRLLRGTLEWLPILRVVSGLSNQQMKNAVWPIVQPPNSVPFQIKLNGYLQNSITFQQKAIKIDSLTTNTPYFNVVWRGPLNGELRQPPSEIAVNIDYLVNIFFTPDKYEYYQDMLTIHFNNGMKRYIPLYGNSFNVDIEKLLVLTEPVRGTVLSPCQDVTVKWTGHDPTNPVEVYYSTDAGLEWDLIDIVRDSSYTWKIPDIETKFLRFRVRQGFNNTREEILSEDLFPIYSVNYNYPGTVLSSLNSMGKIMTWDLATGGLAQILRRHYIEEILEDSEERFYSFGLEYSVDTDKFYAGYRNYTYPFFLQRDTIAVFNSNEIYPVKKIALPTGFRTKSLKSDRLKKYLIAFPEYGPKMLQYSMEDERLIKEISFEAPIMDVAFNTNSDSAAVLLINGRIKLVSLDNFSVFDEMFYEGFPNFIEIAYSPNGKFLSIGAQTDNSGLTTDIYMIDIASKRIARVFNPSTGNPVALQFNPTSTALLIGSETEKQIAIYDLTTNQASANMFGHRDDMTDMKMSPSGFSIVSTSIARFDNIVYRTFTYPQEDRNGFNILVEKPKLNEEIVRIYDAYLGTDNTHNISSICNIGVSMADITDAHFKSSVHFRLPSEWRRDTTYPSECFNFDIVYSPLDTGMIQDTLILYHCSKKYLIPFQAYSIPRKITLLSNGYDFGEVCIGDTNTLEIPLFRNDDPVPLVLNYTTIKEKDDLFFENLKLVKDTILQPGDIYIAKLRFVPTALGKHDADIIIHHSNQTRIFTSSKVFGTGIGSYVEISHDFLRFIPEITTREITIKNIGATDIYFEDLRVSPLGAFEVLTSAGFTLKPNEIKTIEIKWNGIDEIQSQFIIDANPCLVQRFIQLGFYRGESFVSLPEITTEAYNENVRIPILYQNFENGPYNGERNFNAEFTVNSKIFLPTSIETKYSSAELTSNRTENGSRTFGINVTGDFAPSDTLAIIYGVAGLTDIDRSPLIMTGGVAWSTFVKTTADTGMIIISGICEDRYIIRNNPIIKEMLVIPNPAVVSAKLRFELFESSQIMCEIIDNNGTAVQICNNFQAHAGENILDLDLSNFGTGNYKVRLSSKNDFSVVNLIILR